jgi:TPR repeat protein
VLLAVLWVYGRPYLLNIFDKQPADQSAPAVAATGGAEPSASSDDDRSFAVAEEAFARNDYALALSMFTRLAEKGRAAAQSYLGEMYAEGFGTRQDFAQAAIWYQRAAAQGHVVAENNLGVFYDNGTGVTRDYGRAVALFRSAAEQGMMPAKCNLAEMYAGGKGVAMRLAREVSDSGGEPCLELQEKYGISLPTPGR